MHEFDMFIKQELKIKYYLRYADDFAIFSDNKRYLEELLPKMEKFLNERLKLKLHENKVYIKTYASGVDFLGWIHFPKHRVLRTATKRRMFKNISENTKEETIESYLGMLSHGNTYKLRNFIVRKSWKKSDGFGWS